MKKKILLILILFIFPIIVLADEEEAIKGSLRCPSDTGAATCTETKEGDTVTSVKVVEETKVDNGSIKVTKTVSKTENIGEYNVKFNVEASGIEQQETVQKARVVVLVDNSRTIDNDQWTKIKTAVNNFIKNQKAGIFEIAVIQFSGKGRAKVIKEFDDEKVTYTDTGNASFISDAFQKANELFEQEKKEVGTDFKKYVVIFGDGRYYEGGQWSDISDENGSYAKRNMLISNNNNVEIYGIRYDAKSDNHPNGSECRDCDTRINYVYKGTTKNTSFTFSDVFMKTNISNQCKGEDVGDNVGQSKMTWGCLDSYMMQKLVSSSSHYYYAGSSNNFESSFTSIAEKIERAPEVTGYDATLEDELGDNFYDKSNHATSKIFTIGNLNDNYSSEEFTIKISDSAFTDWHNTNAGFQISYTAVGGVEKVLKYNVNPEVYWVQENKNIEGCNGEMLVKETADTNSIIEEYYTKVCEEGYEDNGEFKHGFTAKISVNNFDADAATVYEFDVEQGIGFPTNIKMNANVRCTFTFDTDKFNTKYNEVTNRISQLEKDLTANRNTQASLTSTINSKEIERDNTPKSITSQVCTNTTDNNNNNNENNDNGDTSQDNEISKEETSENNCSPFTYDNPEYSAIEDKLRQLNSELQTYIDAEKVLNGELEDAKASLDNLEKALKNFRDTFDNNTMQKDLEDYEERFKELEANMNIKYSNSSESIKLVNDDKTVVTNLDCDKFTAFVKNEEIIVKEVCTANFEKEMVVPKTCLDMKTGASEECKSSNTQLDGGNKVYVNQEEDEGEITISIPNAGYKGDLELGSEKCNFYKSDLDIIYRQIDVSDPFLSTYDTTREVGRNFSNNLFNFQNIIKSDIWSSDPLSSYKMSKVNVEEIKDDTESVDDSYLGSSCYFTTNNKYVCDFLTNENGNFFQK